MRADCVLSLNEELYIGLFGRNLVADKSNWHRPKADIARVLKTRSRPRMVLHLIKLCVEYFSLLQVLYA